METRSKTLQNIGKNIFSLVASEVVCKILGAVVLLLLPRYLGPTDYGRYVLAISFFTLFAVFTEYGLNGIFIKDVSRDKELSQRYFCTALVIKFVLSIVSIIVLGLVVFSFNYPTETTLAILMLGSTIFLQSITQSYSGVFRAYEKMEYNALFAIARSVPYLIGIVLIIQFNGGVLTLILLLICINFILALAGFILINKRLFKIKWNTDYRFMLECFKKSTPFFLVGAIAIIHNRVDIVMISKLSTDMEVGFYSAASELISMLYVIPELCCTVLFPVFSKFHHESPDSLIKSSNLSIKYIGLLGLPISAGIFFVAHPVISIIYGESFTGSVQILQVLGLTICILFVSSIMAYILTATERVNHVTRANTSSLVVNIVLNFLLVPIWGGVGAAIATLFCSFIKSIYIYRVLLISFDCRIAARNILKPLIATCFMAAVLWFTQTNLYLTILIGAASYMLFLVLMKTFTKEEIGIFKTMLPIPQRNNQDGSEKILL